MAQAITTINASTSNDAGSKRRNRRIQKLPRRSRLVSSTSRKANVVTKNDERVKNIPIANHRPRSASTIPK